MLVSGVLGPFALDATRVFFTAPSTPAAELRAVPKGGGPQSTISEASGYDLSDGPTDVLWSIQGAIRDISTADGSAHDLSTDGLFPDATKLDPANVYFRSKGNVYALARTGGPVRLLRSAPAAYWNSIDAYAQVVYWDETAFTSAGSSGCIGQVRADGSDVRCIDQGPHSYGNVKVDDTAVYFVRDNELVRIPKG